jgi:hypothetical protein
MDYIQSSKFHGVKPGYIFTTRENGTGYYKESISHDGETNAIKNIKSNDIQSVHSKRIYDELSIDDFKNENDDEPLYIPLKIRSPMFLSYSYTHY